MLLNKNRNNEIITEEYDDMDYNNYEISDTDYEDAIEDDKKSLGNIIIIIIIALVIMIATDIVMVTKYDKGPYFAIRTKTYDDGGTQVFYGLGYKVIKYHQEKGRRDTKLGFWTMKYSDQATEISTLDLAIEFRNNPEKTAKKFAGQFVKMTGTIYKIKDNKLILRYKDPDKIYTLKVNCSMAEDENLNDLEKGMEVTVLGTIENFTTATKNNTNSVKMNSCIIR